MPQIDYNYDDVPTIGRFSNSDAFIRGLMGPFGCLPAHTEFLTPYGWKPMAAYRPGDQVAQWHRNGRIEFVAPQHFTEIEARDLIEFDSGSLVMQLTDEHRVPHLDWKGAFAVKTAREIAAKPSRRTIPTTFTGPYPGGFGWSDDLIRFAVMMHADGHYPRHGKRAILTVRKDRKKSRFKALMARLGVEWREFSSPKRPTEARYSFLPPYRGKNFTSEWWSCNAHELSVVLDEVNHWDGHTGEIIVYSSAAKADADFIQYAAHACGRRAVISRVDYENPRWKPNYRVAIRTADNAKNRACIREETAIRRLPTPNGKAYCFTVPTGFFVARHQDTIFITGNSGKSSGCVTEFPYRGQMQIPSPDGKRRTRWAVVRNTYPQLRDTTIKTFHQWLPPAYFGRYTSNDHRYVINAFPGCEMEILFRALDKPDDVKDLLSLDLTGAWVNEAREVPWVIIEALMGRVGRYPGRVEGGCTWSGIWMDTNPPDSDSKWYRFFEEEEWRRDYDELKNARALPPGLDRPEDFAAIFKQPSGISPAAENLPNLPVGYYHRLGIGKTEEWKKVYIHGRYGFVSDNKTVFPEFKDELHIKAKDPVPGVTVERNWDFGLCYSDDTEVLTFDGWKLFKDVDEKRDQVATRDPANGRMEYVLPNFKIARPYKGEMLEWSSTELNICVTPEHRVPFTYRDSPRKVHWQTAEWLANHMTGHHYVDLLASWQPISMVRGGCLGMEPMAYAQFMGLYLSEGSVGRRQISVYQKHRRPDMEAILMATGLDWRWFCHGKVSGWRVGGGQLAEELKKLGTSRHKYIPSDLRFLPPAHLRAFIMAYTAGDGHIRTRRNGAEEHTIFTTSTAMAGDLQDVIQKAGWNSSVRWQRPSPNSGIMPDGRKINSTGGWALTVKKTASRAELLKRNFKRIQYDGMIYCLNVPHHTLYVRRGGKPSWNGNTPAVTFSQVLPNGQWLVFAELIATNMGVDRFSDEVLEWCAKTFKGPVDFDDLGDPSGDFRKDTDEKTCFLILQGKGIMVRGGEQNIQMRLESLRKPLLTLGDYGEPRMVVHPRCKNVRKAFLGAYFYRRMATNAERFSKEPEKNHPFSDLMDGLQYRAVEHFGALVTREPVEDIFSRPQPRSNQGRSRVTGY